MKAEKEETTTTTVESAANNLVGITRVGTSTRKNDESLRFVFYNFKHRKEQRGEHIISPILKACGFWWALKVYPRGEKTKTTTNTSSSSITTNNDAEAEADADNDHTEYLSCYLHYFGDRNREATVWFSMRCKTYIKRYSVNVFSEDFTERGSKEYLPRREVLAEYLQDDGSFIVDVDLHSAVHIWYPDFQPQPILPQLYRTISETYDVMFHTVDKDGRAEHHATHKGILFCKAKGLYQLHKEFNGEQQHRSIPIPDMTGGTLRCVLEFMYGVKVPTINTFTVAKELLVAADRCGCLQLKLYVESILTEKFLSADNAAELFVLSDTLQCALLKEAAMELHATETTAVMESEEWVTVQESNRLLTELFQLMSVKLAAATTRPTLLTTTASSSSQVSLSSLLLPSSPSSPLSPATCTDDDESNTDNINSNMVSNDYICIDSSDSIHIHNNTNDTTDALDVTTLRIRLQEAKLHVDGSREALVERLQCYRKKLQQQQQQQQQGDGRRR